MIEIRSCPGTTIEHGTKNKINSNENKNDSLISDEEQHDEVIISGYGRRTRVT